MAYAVDFKNVSTAGLESSPVAEALAGLHADLRRRKTGAFRGVHRFRHIVQQFQCTLVQLRNRLCLFSQ